MKTKFTKREFIAPRGDKRYIRRDAKDRIKESDDLGRSLSQDKPRKAKTVAKPGQGDRGDRKVTRAKTTSGQPRVPNTNREADLFGADHLPEGFSYAASLLDEAEEQALLAEIRSLPFRDFEFHGFVGKRRVVSFGWRYDFNGGGLSKTEDMPEFLLPLREQAAAFAKIPPQDLQQVLATEYGAGAAIGWHRDRSVFGDVVGISLLSSCTFRLRRKQGGRWQRANLTVEPRSVYLLRGPSRTEWEHSIPAVSTLRYSITFRNVLDRG